MYDLEEVYFFPSFSCAHRRYIERHYAHTYTNFSCHFTMIHLALTVVPVNQLMYIDETKRTTLDRILETGDVIMMFEVNANIYYDIQIRLS